jgi:hypothetical protein
LRHTGDLPALFRAFNSVADLSEPLGELGVKGGFVIGRVPFQIAELTGFPSLLHTVPSGVESETVRVQVRVWNALDRTRRKMVELRPYHVPCIAFTVLPLNPDARFHLRFQFPHGFRDRHFERPENPLIPVLLVHYRHRFWAMEIEVVTDAPILFRSRRQRFIGTRFQIIGQRIKGSLVNPSRQSQAFSGQSLPLTNDLLPFRVVIFPAQTLSVILLGLTGTDADNNPQHGTGNIKRAMHQRKK